MLIAACDSRRQVQFLFSVQNDAMPGMDFAAVRAQVSMAQVLDLLGFVAHERSGNQVRGACPVHRSRSSRSRSFSVNLDDNVYRCFKCGSSGGTLELWAAVHGTSVYAAAIDLCDRLSVEVPWVRKW